MAFVNCTTLTQKINEIKEFVKNSIENKQGKLRDCSGFDLPDGTQVPSCSEMNTEIEKNGNTVLINANSYTDEKIKESNNIITQQGENIEEIKNQLKSKQGKLKDCRNNDLPDGTQVPSCSEMVEKINEKTTETLESANNYTDKEIAKLSDGLINLKNSVTNLPSEIKNQFKEWFKEKITTLISETKWTLKEENDELKLVLPKCRAKVKTVRASYTINSDDEVLIVENGGILIVPNLDIGREVMVIQSGADTVTLNGAGGVQLIAPVGGSLSLLERNAVVTLLATEENVVRVFGQTKGD